MSNFIIFKSYLPSEDTPGYWDDNAGDWTETMEEATTFPIDILTVPFPKGATHILEIDDAGEILKYFEIQPLPPQGIEISVDNQ